MTYVLVSGWSSVGRNAARVVISVGKYYHVYMIAKQKKKRKKKKPYPNSENAKTKLISIKGISYHPMRHTCMDIDSKRCISQKQKLIHFKIVCPLGFMLVND